MNHGYMCVPMKSPTPIDCWERLGFGSPDITAPADSLEWSVKNKLTRIFSGIKDAFDSGQVTLP
ncbi:hypothetical protein VKT23_000322 [Stygiomarasmius scandens]|uniref:Uncharacterized protein n=1 Tax=Marasmiellus scandens TaxID=2682957 RepID=A0ABR1K3R4_9AGAR